MSYTLVTPLSVCWTDMLITVIYGGLSSFTTLGQFPSAAIAVGRFTAVLLMNMLLVYSQCYDAVLAH